MDVGKDANVFHLTLPLADKVVIRYIRLLRSELVDLITLSSLNT